MNRVLDGMHVGIQLVDDKTLYDVDIADNIALIESTFLSPNQ